MKIGITAISGNINTEIQKLIHKKLIHKLIIHKLIYRYLN